MARGTAPARQRASTYSRSSARRPPSGIEPQEIPVVIEELASRILPVANRLEVKPMAGYAVVGDIAPETLSALAAEFRAAAE